MVEDLVMTGLCFDQYRLKDRLSRLSHRSILTYGVWQLERMIPNFIQFCVETHSEGVWTLKGATTYAWSVIETGNVHRFNELTADMCEKVAPETVGSKSIYTSSALDAAVSAGNLIRYVHIGDVDLITEMSSLARDSADVFIQLAEYVHEHDEHVEEAIRTHPLMQTELQRQETDIIFLERLPKDEGNFFPAVLARSLAEPYGKKWL